MTPRECGKSAAQAVNGSAKVGKRSQKRERSIRPSVRISATVPASAR